MEDGESVTTLLRRVEGGDVCHRSILRVAKPPRQMRGSIKKGPAGFRLALGGVLAFEVLFNSFLSSICAIFNMFFDFMVKAEAIKDRNSKNDCETNSDPNRNKKISYQPDEQSDSIKRT